MSKYGARRTEYNGRVYDSGREATRAAELRLMQRAGLIKDLREQVDYELLPSQKDEAGKTIERPVRYRADFVYTDVPTNQTIVEDVKGCRTKEYIIKRKIMLFLYGIRIKEV